MHDRWNRRTVLKKLLMAGGALMFPAERSGASPGTATRSAELEIQIASVSPQTLRLSLLSVKDGQATAIPFNGSLAHASWGAPVATLRGDWHAQVVNAGEMRVLVDPDPLAFTITNMQGTRVQRLTIDRETGVVGFETGSSPLFGLGEGGPQFDRRGSVDRMASGQGVYKLRTHGGRVPIPWIIGSAGWAIFFHQPFGTFNLTGAQSRFEPGPDASSLPLDLFFVASPHPAAIMGEYARLTGHAEFPPLWSLGYQQSHRTLSSREEVLEEADTFRQKKLPCDALIYLGTGFCPSGWNTENGSFVWNSRVFPDPKEVLNRLHEKNFHAVLHAVILSDKLRGTVHDPCELSQFDESEASCYWDAHRKDFAMGVDGWWPDEGDPLDIPSRLLRNRMYWEGPQLDRPNERPYALHRNGYAGMQRYASFLWSGDVYSTWETSRPRFPSQLTLGSVAFLTGEQTSGASFPLQNSPRNSTCAGFSLELFALCFAVTAAPGSCAFHGVGAPVTLARSRYATTTELQLPTPVNFITRKWNPFAENISNCATACCPTFTAWSASVRPRACRSCGLCGCISRMIPGP
jgi:alpha-glucosidase (family GH31 glycosyl hydrolase)